VALVGGDSDVQPAVDGICEVVARQFDNAREFLPALEWAVQEMVDNIITHADSPVPGVVIAQYFPKKHRLAVAICDMGRGLKRALEQSFELWSHGDAITKALEKGVTRSKEIGMGFGLAGTLQISRLNGGRFWIWTGDASCFLAGDSRRFRPLPTAPGTGVAFTLDTRRPVPMTKTFMGEPTQTYFETQSEKVAELGGLRVLDEVASTGTRRSARALRRKVEGILPEMDRPLVLDFDGVARTTSSFLDELLGRLVASLGAEDWRRRVRIQGLRPEFQALANTVIHERIRIEADPNVR